MLLAAVEGAPCLLSCTWWLRRAAERGNWDAVNFLLSTDPRRADVQAFTKRSALHCAAANGHTDICKMLLEANADVSLHGCNSHFRMGA